MGSGPPTTRMDPHMDSLTLPFLEWTDNILAQTAKYACESYILLLPLQEFFKINRNV